MLPKKSSYSWTSTTKQVRVPRSLLVQLEPELRLGPDDPEQDLRSLHSELAVDLSQSDRSGSGNLNRGINGIAA